MREFKTASLADQVFEKLENDIIQGVYPKGEILTELKLVDQLGVSRTPIREAMRLLDWQDKSTAVLLRDSRYDGEGAMEAGVDFVPLTYGFGFAEPGSMDGLVCTAVAEKPEDVFRFVQAQFA